MSNASDEKQRLVRELLRFREEPEYWFQKVCGITLTDQQLSLVKCVKVRGSKNSVKSGHGSGKSFLMGGLGLWFLSVFQDDTQVPVTAPTSHQLEDNFFGAVAKIYSSMLPAFKDRLIMMKNKVVVKGLNRLQIKVIGRSI